MVKSDLIETLPQGGSGWITGVGSVGNLSTATGSSDPGVQSAPATARPLELPYFVHCDQDTNFT